MHRFSLSFNDHIQLANLIVFERLLCFEEKPFELLNRIGAGVDVTCGEIAHGKYAAHTQLAERFLRILCECGRGAQEQRQDPNVSSHKNSPLQCPPETELSCIMRRIGTTSSNRTKVAPIKKSAVCWNN